MAKSLEQQLSDVLVLYSQEVTEQIKQDTETVAKETRQRIKESGNFKNRTGKYRRGWKVKKAFESANEVRFRVYNTRYQLTHLLEKGHAKKDGGRVRAYPHIRPAELWAQKEFVNLVKKAVQK